MNSIRNTLACYALGSLLSVAATADVSAEAFTKKTGEQLVFLDQGWSPMQRAQFYQTSQGSRMLPYAWFLQLEQARSDDKFSAADNLRKMGFLVDGRSADNPDRLPVGFARDVDPTKGDAIGLTCAACHTNEVQFNDRTIRIDGGQSLGDIEQLQNGMLASLSATLQDRQKFNRFASKLIGKAATPEARAGLRQRMEQYRDWWQARVQRSRGLTPHGPSRTDAFTIIANEVVCLSLAIADNCAPAVAPTQFPFLWNTPDFDWVQYNSSVHSALGRNVGEVTGVFAEMSIAADGAIQSSANIDNIYDLEELLKQLTAPAWPEDILGAIDQNLAAQGETLYAEQCAGCHSEGQQPRTAPNLFGLTFAKVNFATPLSVLQTDPTAAMSFATRRAYPGVLTAAANQRGIIGADGKAPVAALLNISTSGIISQFFANGPLLRSPIAYLGYRESLSPSIAQLTTYKARPLNGIAFTAPYLHNGSVASIYELLLPAAERLPEFYVGSTEFDPVNLGYATQREDNTVLLDTRALGNSNSGHEFGTAMNHDQRMAVIEYLKTLK